jgi:hypothetical protein
MFKTCQYCGSTFKNVGNFCSDMCEIKSYTPMLVKFETEIVSTGTKQELDQVKEISPEMPIVINKVAEIREKLTQVEKGLEYEK